MGGRKERKIKKKGLKIVKTRERGRERERESKIEKRTEILSITDNMRKQT